MRVAVIPARGGSQRVPRKNVAPFMGRPMIMYPIVAARDSGLFDLIVVSTDDLEIAEVAFASKCVVVPRPTDDGSTGTQEIAARVLDQLEVTDIACVIYATSPLLLPEDLKRGWEALHRADHLTKSYAMSVGPDGHDCGNFYFGWARAFRARVELDLATTVKVPLPAERVRDINTHEDMYWAGRQFAKLVGVPYAEIKGIKEER
jgi:hypothetical protein